MLNGHLLWLMQSRKKRTWLATLMPRGWLVPADELGNVDPRRLLEQLRAVFVRAKISWVGGWAYFVLDVEYIEHLDAYAFHVHGLTTKGIAKFLKGLRERRKFKWPRGSDGVPKRPIQVKLINRGEEARAANYLVKDYIGQHVHIVDNDGVYVRTRQRAAMPEPRNSEMIAWLARWSIDDFVLPINVYFGRDRLELSRCRTK